MYYSPSYNPNSQSVFCLLHWEDMKRNESAKGHPTHLKQCAQVELDHVFSMFGVKILGIFETTT